MAQYRIHLYWECKKCGQRMIAQISNLANNCNDTSVSINSLLSCNVCGHNELRLVSIPELVP